MKYNRNAHIENNHRKHSLAHAYAQDGTYLGETKSINVTSNTDAIARNYPQAESVIYDSDTGQTIIYGENKSIITQYENIYSQNAVILGQRKI